MVTFAEAASSYVENGGQSKYLPRVVDYLGDRPIKDIVPFDIKRMALDLYPNTKNSTRNRHALTPARSVIIHGYERGWCNLMRLPSFKEDPPKRKKPASLSWLHIFARQCEIDRLPYLAALVLFMAQTGARVSEAVDLRWSEVDLATRKVLILKTKTSRNSVRHLTDDLVSRLQLLHSRYPSGPQDHVFLYTSRYAVNERIKAVCDRAGIAYKSSHACGRHSFATNAMALGLDIKTTMEAGDWRSSAVFLETYVHVQDASRHVADRFNSSRFAVDT